MSAVVKYPSRVTNEPDCRFCGQCGRRVQPMLAKGDGFGPCIEDAASVIDCRDFRSHIVQAYGIAEAMGRDGVHEETVSLIARLGVPSEAIAEWRATAKRIAEIKDYLRRGTYGQATLGGAPWMPALEAWVNDGDSGEKILALIEELKVHCDPMADGAPKSWMEICDWFGRLGKRAEEILSDPGDWEMGEGE